MHRETCEVTVGYPAILVQRSASEPATPYASRIASASNRNPRLSPIHSLGEEVIEAHLARRSKAYERFQLSILA